MYHITLLHKEVDYSEFCAKYHSEALFKKYCEECENYNTVWTCPPYSFSPDEYLAPYSHIVLVLAKLDVDEDVRTAADTPEKAMVAQKDVFIPVKREIERRMRELEEELPESISLSSGGCNLCCRCTRRKDEPCRKPDLSRYSLDGFGFDLSRIAKDYFGVDILWDAEHVPPYLTLVHALLSKRTIPAAVVDPLLPETIPELPPRGRHKDLGIKVNG